jgi:hypothetical protein
MTWVGNNKVDFATNDIFETNDAFTWNYSKFQDTIDGELLPGSWRACFQYFFDTVRPHLMPWEMLGFSTEPDWWQAFYGPGPYTGGNKLLWDDLEEGIIRQGNRAGVDVRYRRPGLSRIIPVDENGFLKSPAQIITKAFSSNRAGTAWGVGQYGPAEYAWRTSSDFAFAVQLTLAVSKPAQYFGGLMDTYRYTLNIDLDQYLTTGGQHHIRQNDIGINGDETSGTVYRSAGYLNWIGDYLRNQGINPVTKIGTMLKNYSVNLAYKMSGFTDQR